MCIFASHNDRKFFNVGILKNNLYNTNPHTNAKWGLDINSCLFI